MSQFFGKYRGRVENNVDPQNLGRLQVSAPAVLGGGIWSWAMPCTPYAGAGVGFHAVPPLGANVWVEFEAGDANYPIWSGCFWGAGELPSEAQTPGTNVFKTEKVTMKLVDVAGSEGFSVETDSGVKIEMTPELVTLDNAHDSSISITHEAINIRQSQGSVVTIDAEGIQVDNGQGATIKLAAQGVQVDNGKGATVDLQGPKVAINKSALEVT